ncbi:MAG: acetolactate synthase [Opitutaceae bacterium]
MKKCSLGQFCFEIIRACFNKAYTLSAMTAEVMRDPGAFEPVVQFSVHADNKVGRLNEIIGLLAVHEVHIMAISVLDTTDSSIIRLIVDYPSEAQKLLIEHQFSYVQSELIAVELTDESEVSTVTFALVQAEINIHYIYPFLVRPNGRFALAISLEDNELAAETLRRHQLRIIGQGDIAR